MSPVSECPNALVGGQHQVIPVGLPEHKKDPWLLCIHSKGLGVLV